MVQPTLALNIQSRASTVGFVGGADLTSRALFSASDGLIAGVTAGYAWSELNLNTLRCFNNRLNPPVGTGVSSPTRHSFGADGRSLRDLFQCRIFE